MPIQDYSTDPDLNVQISGINIAEGCPPSGINNAIRQLMADVKEESEAKAEAITAAGEALEAFAEEQTTKDDEQDVAISTAQNTANAAGQAAANAQSSADAAQAKADQALAKESVLPGTVVAWAANSTPNGYLLCNGATVSRTTYAALFSAIGTTYGTGDGSTTFNLPDLTDRFVQGSGTAGTVKAAGAPNIAGSFGPMYSGTATSTSKDSSAPFSFRKTSNKNYDGASGSDNQWGIWTMDLSTSSTVYRDDCDTIQPPALTMRYYIKY